MKVYTDGGCSGNPGPGGWAWASSRINYDYGYIPQTTNQRMELTAALKALESLDTPRLEVVSDSSYLVNCFKQKWYMNWQKNGWIGSSKKPVANRDIWEPLIDIAIRNVVQFTWVKGHSGHPMNDFVDELAVNAYRVR
jgi:ribonuclease HI